MIKISDADIDAYMLDDGAAAEMRGKGADRSSPRSSIHRARPGASITDVVDAQRARAEHWRR